MPHLCQLFLPSRCGASSAKCLLLWHHFLNNIVKMRTTDLIFWANVCKTLRPMLSGRCPVGQCPLWPNCWMDLDATWYGGRPRPRRLCARWGPSSPRKKGTASTQFLAHEYCGKTTGWIKMPLGTEVNLGPGDVVLDGVAAPPKRDTAPSFRFMSIVTKRLDVWRHRLVRK